MEIERKEVIELQIRNGRLNIIRFIDKKKIYKIGVIKESKRPSRLGVECWALEVARKYGINVPKVIDYYLSRKKQEILVLERIDGKRVSVLCFNERKNCMQSVGSQMMKLADISSGFGWIDPLSKKGTSISWKSFLCLYINEYGKRLVREKIFSRDDLQKIIDYLEILDLQIRIPYLINRDIKTTNLIKSVDEKIWILDWENAILGDPLYDIAMFGARRGRGELWKNLVNGYGVDINCPEYNLYEIAILIGIIEFNRKLGIKKNKDEEKVHDLINNLKI